MLELLPQSISTEAGCKHRGNNRHEHRESRIMPQGVQRGEVVLNRNLAPLSMDLFDKAMANHIHIATFIPQRHTLNREFLQSLQTDRDRGRRSGAISGRQG